MYIFNNQYDSYVCWAIFPQDAFYNENYGRVYSWKVSNHINIVLMWITVRGDFANKIY